MSNGKCISFCAAKGYSIAGTGKSSMLVKPLCTVPDPGKSMLENATVGWGSMSLPIHRQLQHELRRRQLTEVRRAKPSDCLRQRLGAAL